MVSLSNHPSFAMSILRQAQDEQEKVVKGTLHRPWPAALYYHGFNASEGSVHIDIFDCDPDFIRGTINGKHGCSFGSDPAAGLHDKLVRQGVDALRMTADLLEHLLERPKSSLWHPRIYQWHQDGRLDDQLKEIAPASIAVPDHQTESAAPPELAKRP